MRRITHLTLGAAVVLPIAASLSPALPVAIGCFWWGMVGGGFPDWFDLRSEFRKPLRLRHRGASHGLPLALLLTILLCAGLLVLAAGDAAPFGMSLSPTRTTAIAWSASFFAGFLSHLISDSCTISGIRPFLPFSRIQYWSIPKVFRCRHDGYIDRILFLGSIGVLGIGLISAISARVS